MKLINFTSTPEFEKDKKSLIKKYRTLEEDLKVFIQYAATPFHLDNKESSGINKVPGFENERFKLYKVTKFACKTLKSRGAKSGIRLIYAYYETETTLEMIQMYFKADSENMNYERAREYMRGVISKY
jgi:hypothetical protein